MEAHKDGPHLRAIPVIERDLYHPSLAADAKAAILALTNRLPLIGLCILVALVLGIGYLWITPPKYSSTAEILLDPRERKLVDTDVVTGGLGSSSQGADASLVESQVEILKSRSVLTDLIAQQQLQSDPDFGGNAGESSLPVRLIKGLIYGPNASNYQGLSSFDRAMTALVDAIDVERVGNTYVLRITATTPTPDKAALIANGLAELYLAEGQSANKSSGLEAAAALEGRLAELRAQSDDAQRAVEQYRADHGLLGADGVLVDEQQLRDLNDQVTKASIETQSAKAALDEVQRLADEPLSATAGSSILSSTVVEELRAKLDAARAEETSLSGVYGDRHPLLIVAVEKRQALERSIADELERIVSRTRSEYAQASQNEAALRTLLSQSEARRAASNNASIELRELERQATSKQELLETFLVRSDQIREQIDLPTNNARVISPAIANSQPTSPRLALSLIVALVLGAVTGIGLAWLLHLLHDTPDKPRPARRPARRPTSVAEATMPTVRTASVQLAREEIVAAHGRSATPTRLDSHNSRQRLITGLFR